MNPDTPPRAPRGRLCKSCGKETQITVNGTPSCLECINTFLANHPLPAPSAGQAQPPEYPDEVNALAKLALEGGTGVYSAVQLAWKIGLREAAERLRQAQQQIAELQQWKDAIIDAAVVDWVYTKEHETNPHKAVNDLLCWQMKIALDPAVSKPAHDLVERAEKAEQELERLKAERER